MGNFFDNAGGAGDIMENFEKKILFTPFYWITYSIFMNAYNGIYMGDFRPFRPGCDPHYFFSVQVCYGWAQKNDLHEFSDFFENVSGSNGRNRREIWAVIKSLETSTIKCLMKKKIFETNSIMSRAFFWVAQPK